MSTSILEMQSINSMNNDVLGFVKPMFNGVMIISPQLLNSAFKGPYYGDTVTIAFWKALNIEIGTKTTDTPLHVQTGYSYKYNHTRKTFTVYNDTGSRVSKVFNIASIADMGIDFSIYKSHQLEIIIESNDLNLLFFVPTQGNKPNIASNMKDIGTNWIDNIDIIGQSGYSYQYSSLANYRNDGYTTYNYISEYKAYVASILTGISNNTINYSNVKNNNIFLSDGINCISALEVNDEIACKMIDTTITLSALSMSLYPELMPIEREGETINNRTVYEPWMIWGFYNFIYNKKSTDDSDDFIIDILSLSPNWGE